MLFKSIAIYLLLCWVKLKWVLLRGCTVKGGYCHQKDALLPSLSEAEKV